MVIKNEWEGGPSKKTKTYHFIRNGRWTFFQDVIFEVRMPRLPIYHRNTKDVKRLFLDCSRKIGYRLPAEEQAKKEKGEGSKIPLVQTVVIFHTTTSKAKASFRMSHDIVKNKKLIQDGEVVKEAFIEAADSMFRDF